MDAAAKVGTEEGREEETPLVSPRAPPPPPLWGSAPVPCSHAPLSLSLGYQTPSTHHRRARGTLRRTPCSAFGRYEFKNKMIGRSFSPARWSLRGRPEGRAARRSGRCVASGIGREAVESSTDQPGGGGARGGRQRPPTPPPAAAAAALSPLTRSCARRPRSRPPPPSAPCCNPRPGPLKPAFRPHNNIP